MRNLLRFSLPRRPRIHILDGLDAIVLHVDDARIFEVFAAPADFAAEDVAPGLEVMLDDVLEPFEPAIEFFAAVPFDAFAVVGGDPLAIDARPAAPLLAQRLAVFAGNVLGTGQFLENLVMLGASVLFRSNVPLNLVS